MQIPRAYFSIGRHNVCMPWDVLSAICCSLSSQAMHWYYTNDEIICRHVRYIYIGIGLLFAFWWLNFHFKILQMSFRKVFENQQSISKKKKHYVKWMCERVISKQNVVEKLLWRKDVPVVFYTPVLFWLCAMKRHNNTNKHKW